MTPQFHPALINGPFDDPGVYVDFLFERRALLFDLGDLRALPHRKVLRISHVCVSHTHIDHFIGFDQVLRLCLGRDKRLHLFGPPGFTAQVGHRLAAYTWDLVENYATDFTVTASEIHPDGRCQSADFHCRSGFQREGEATRSLHDGILLDEETLRLRAVFLEHSTPTLAFALEEKCHINILKNRLQERGLPTGPWLAELKRCILRGADDATPFTAWWRDGATRVERSFTLGELKATILQIVPGQKIAYVTDTFATPANAARIVELARGADTLFIEATFLDADSQRAAERHHLTARQAGELARAAGVARVVPFHFSPRYLGREEELRRELGW
jgi:ribonuclease Z